MRPFLCCINGCIEQDAQKAFKSGPLSRLDDLVKL